MHPTLTPGIDVALLCFWAFVLFFVALVFYLRREDRREGYPVEDDLTGRVASPGGPLSMARPKVFHLPFGQGDVTNPTKGREPVDIAARKLERFPGAPLVPTGDPLADGIGPAAWADRAKTPDLDMNGEPRIVPMSKATEFVIARKDPELRGMPVVGADEVLAGNVADVWVDQAERLIRYLEVELADAGGRVLVPMMMTKLQRSRGRLRVDAVLASQFAGAPKPAQAGVITRYEEERVQAYFGGGYLYATPSRQEPFL